MDLCEGTEVDEKGFWGTIMSQNGWSLECQGHEPTEVVPQDLRFLRSAENLDFVLRVMGKHWKHLQADLGKRMVRAVLRKDGRPSPPGS